MSPRPYDAIVVGARCAGSSTALLLTRQGYRALQRWGLVDRLVASGCPPITRYAFDFGPFREHARGGRTVTEHAESMDGFARVFAGVTPPTEFFADNVARILAAST